MRHDENEVRRWLSGGVWVSAFALLVGGFAMVGTGSVAAAAGSKTISVAFEGPMSGADGTYGQDQFRGLQFAIKQINLAGGIKGGSLKGDKLKVKPYDNAAITSEAASVAQQLCGDGKSVAAVFGDTISSSSLTELPIFTRCGLPVVDSYSSSPAMNGKLYPTWFRTILSDSDNGALMAKFAVQNIHMTKIGLIISPDDYGAGLAKVFTPAAVKYGAQVVASVTTSPGEIDFSSELSQLKAAGANGIVMLNEYEDQGAQLKQLNQMGWQVPVLLSTGGNTPALVTLAGNAATNGVYVCAIFNVDNPAPAVKRFVSAFTKAEGQAPGEGSVVAYLSMYMFADALAKGATTSHASIIYRLKHLGTVILPLTGKFAFNALHEPAQIPGGVLGYLLQIKNGVFTQVTTGS